ncbi:hypothetical protein GS982_17870 [Rhodococcus hoagii]|nr:hypothetical protein [Prescottella equi]
MVVHTALAVLLARIGQDRDVVIGTPVAGRGEAELDDVVGMFVNTLALRTRSTRRRCSGPSSPGCAMSTSRPSPMRTAVRAARRAVRCGTDHVVRAAVPGAARVRNVEAPRLECRG